jgi:hypothetical protein
MTALALTWLACTDRPAATVPHDPAVDRLIRASMALRGIRPSAADVLAVHEEPDLVPALVDGYAAGDDFGATMRDLHANDWLVRSDAHHLPPAATVPEPDDVALGRAVLEEPLRLVEWIIREDRPYREIVTSDRVVADADVAAVWGLDRSGGDVTRWADGRPAAGILASSGLWFRITSNGHGYNRARANDAARALVCEDFLTTDVPIDALPFSDERAIADAVRQEPQCTACHANLDPIASYFFGFSRNVTYSDVASGCAAGDCYPLSSWDSSAVDHWKDVGMPPPAWFGVAGGDLADLGAQIAADPRFGPCAARRFLGWFEQVPARSVDTSDVEALTTVFEDSGGRAVPLARAAVDRPSFRDAPPLPIRPEQLSRTLSDLTGWRWTDGALDRLTSDARGFRTLGGGIDHYYLTTPDAVPGPTRSLVVSRAAEGAAAFVVPRDLAEPDRRLRKLLDRVDADTRDEATVRAQLVALHVRILGEILEPDDPEIDATWELFQSVSDPTRAWENVLAAMLADARLEWY